MFYHHYESALLELFYLNTNVFSIIPAFFILYRTDSSRDLYSFKPLLMLRQSIVMRMPGVSEPSIFLGTGTSLLIH